MDSLHLHRQLLRQFAHMGLNMSKPQQRPAVSRAARSETCAELDPR